MSDLQPVRILIAEGDENAAENLVSALRNAAIPVRAQFVANAAALHGELQRQAWDLLLLRQGTEVGALADVVTLVRQYDAALPVLSLETAADPARLTNAMRDGAADAILPGQEERLLLVVRRELTYARERARLRRAERAASEVGHRADLLLDVIDAGVAYVLDGMHVAANRVYLQMFGYLDLDDLLGATMLDLVADAHKDAFKQSLRAIAAGATAEFAMHGQHREGATFEATMTVITTAYEGEPCWQIVLRPLVDAGTRPAAAAPGPTPLRAAIPVATTTAETNLAAFTAREDRTPILAALQSCHARATTDGRPVTIALLLVTNYAEVRARAGIETTWRLTSAIAGLLDAALPPPHRVLRVADDVFALLLHDMDATAAGTAAEQLAHDISAHCARDSAGTLAVRFASTTAPLPGDVPISLAVLSELLRPAAPQVSPPTAASDAGRTGTGVGGTSEPRAPPPYRERIVPRVQECLADNTFVLFFQPIISVRGDSDEHYEAFLRMPLTPNGTAMLSAEEFLEPALHAGLGGKIDRWVILHSIKLLSAHRASGHDTRLTINLSETSMLDPEFVTWLGVAIRAARLPTDALIFQVTEHDAVANLQPAKAFMRGMHDLHCRTSLSRFTGGGNPTQLLRHLSVDFVKLDPTLIDAVQEHPERKEELSKLIAMLQSQGRLTIVPMVENAKLLAALWQAGANYIQGHYLQEPTTAMDFDFTSDE